MKLSEKDWIASEQSSSQRRDGDTSSSRLREPPEGAWRSRNLIINDFSTNPKVIKCTL